jgi:hypothetical protein
VTTNAYNNGIALLASVLFLVGLLVCSLTVPVILSSGSAICDVHRKCEQEFGCSDDNAQGVTGRR